MGAFVSDASALVVWRAPPVVTHDFLAVVTPRFVWRIHSHRCTNLELGELLFQSLVLYAVLFLVPLVLRFLF